MKKLFELFFCFVRIGAITFGGGYAMLPILEKELIEKRNWTTQDELMDYFAIGQCTPGIIAINVSTFIGSRRKGVIGGITATLGFVSLPIIIVTIIAAFLTNFADLPIVRNAFAGIRVCVCVLILNAILRLWKKSVVDVKSFLFFLSVFLLTVLGDYLPFSLSPALLVVAAAIAGILTGKSGKEADAS